MRDVVVSVIVNVIRYVKLMNIQILKMLKKRLFGKLLLECKDLIQLRANVMVKR